MLAGLYLLLLSPGDFLNYLIFILGLLILWRWYKRKYTVSKKAKKSKSSFDATITAIGFTIAVLGIALQFIGILLGFSVPMVVTALIILVGLMTFILGISTRK